MELLQQSESQASSSASTNTVMAYNTNSIALNTIPSTSFGNTLTSWIIDAGATNHITHNMSTLINCKHIKPVRIDMPNNTYATVELAGTIIVSTDLQLHNVLFIPNFHANLVSVPQLISDNNCYIVVTKQTCLFLQNSTQKMIGSARLCHGLYMMEVPVVVSDHNSFGSICNVSPTIPFCNPVSKNSSDNHLWNMRLGHLSHYIHHNMSIQFPFISFHTNKDPCDACQFYKQKKLSHFSSVTNSSHIFEILHADIWGPYAHTSVLGPRYFLTLIDDFSRFTWVILMKSKKETRNHLTRFFAFIETQFNKQVKCLRSDNGVEFLMHDLFSSKGIIHQRTCVDLLNRMVLLKGNINTF